MILEHVVISLGINDDRDRLKRREGPTSTELSRILKVNTLLFSLARYSSNTI